MTDSIKTPPLAEKRPVHRSFHNIELNDDYAWLRAENWQDVMRDPSVLDDEIRLYLEAENAYTNSVLAGTTRLQEEIFQELKGRIKEDDSTVPLPHGPFSYSMRFIEGGQYPQICRQDRHGGDITVLLDGNEEAEGKPFWHLGGTSHSPDHKLLAYAADDKGSELFTARIRDIASGKDLDDAISDTRGDMVWAHDNKTLFYVRLDENHRPLSVYRHVLGTDAARDVLVYEEADTGFYVGLSKTQTDKFIIIESHDHQTSEVRLLDAEAPDSAPILVTERDVGHEYSVEHHGERLIILSNSNGAKDFRILEAPLSSPSRDNWREIEPHEPGRLILDIYVYKNHLVRLEREEGLPRIVVRQIDNGQVHSIAFDEEAYALSITGGYEFDTTTLRFTYSSITTPAEVFDYDLVSRDRTLRKRQEVPSGHNPDDYVARRVYAPAADGESIPVSILHRKSTPIDGSAPLFLYGYGSYGVSIPASFSTNRLSLADRGFVFAIAHVRGGKDKGYGWYEAGKAKYKVNTFTDFIAAGEHLVDLEYTRRGRIVANGGSAGGMLMGAIANIAPDLFLGIIADVPFVDVLNTMLDDTLPLTPPEWPEWGNPIASREDFERIRSYSPYDNVASLDYPHIFAHAGLTDPRVTYWEPAKWIARLRVNNTSSNLVLLRTNMEAGHGGASGRFEHLREVAMNYAFAFDIASHDRKTAKG